MSKNLANRNEPSAPIETETLAAASDEMFIVDERWQLSPSQMVERKLMNHRSASVSVSQMEVAVQDRGISY